MILNMTITLTDMSSFQAMEDNADFARNSLLLHTTFWAREDHIGFDVHLIKPQLS